MGKTNIEWCDYTFNPWMGCAKVSPGCKNCYAETFDKRFKAGRNWGPDNGRQFMKDDYWAKLPSWNDHAGNVGRKHLVFVASHADIFELHKTQEVADQMTRARHRLYMQIEKCQNLIFLLLTKRPENAGIMATDTWHQKGWPDNVMILTSVENQEQADIRIPQLLDVRAKWRGLSVEPLLDAVNIENYLVPIDPMLHWVIVGGESGPKARPMHPDWPADLQAQCVQYKVPFFFKQWGAWQWMPETAIVSGAAGKKQTRRDPSVVGYDGAFVRVGKKKAGRLLDGRTFGYHPFDLSIS